MDCSIKALKKLYEIDLEGMIEKINSSKAKRILLQFPDGLKPYALSVVDYFEEKTKAEFLIWFNSCFGACDIPNIGKKMENEVDLIIQIGHNELMPSY
jgi:2-(3-amino-3-carboxypropyl)histidine synthase